MPVTNESGHRMGRVRCKASRGMFPHEFDVLIRGADRWYESMMDRELVATEGEVDQDDERDGCIAVTIIDREAGRVLVELPRQVVAGGRRIWVQDQELETA